MAKKTGTIRVHQIAKELGVTSKDVVAKCSSEGISQVTNHMSTLSAGLAATIREWFSTKADDGGSAVQTAAPVDIDKARARAKRRSPKPRTTTPEEPKTPATPAPTSPAAIPPPPLVPPPALPPSPQPSFAPEPEIAAEESSPVEAVAETPDALYGRA